MNPSLVKYFSPILLLLFAPLFITAGVFQKKINISSTGKSIEAILLTIQQEHQVNFSYSPDLVSTNELVNLDLEEVSIKEVLDTLFQGEFNYREINNQIVIYPKRNDEKFTITGVIYDAETKRRIPDVDLISKPRYNYTSSDQEGSYELKINNPDKNLLLAFQRKGYYLKEIHLPLEISKPVNIYLQPLKRDTLIELPAQKQHELPPSIENIPIVHYITPEEALTESRKNNPLDDLPIQLGITPRLSTNRLNGANFKHVFSFNLLTGYIGSLNGLEISGLVSIVNQNLKGVEIAGLGNIIGGTAYGIEVGGIFNFNRVSVTGFQISGIYNQASMIVRGGQIAGVTNILKGHIEGAQIAGFNNVATKGVLGFQVAGFNNINWGNLRGFQISGFNNINKGEVVGGQIAGFANNTTADLEGVQISGFYNHAKKLKGTQIGIINICDSIEGTTIGMLNLVKKGYNKLSLFTNESFYANITLRTGSRRFHNIFALGLFPLSDIPSFGVGYGFGSNLTGTGIVQFNIDFLSYWIQVIDIRSPRFNFLSKLHFNFGIRLSPNIEFIFGPSMNVLTAAEFQEESFRVASYEVIDFTTRDNINIKIWGGGNIGFRFDLVKD